MDIKKNTKISQTRWLLLVLCSIVCAISAEVIGAQAEKLPGKPMLRKRLKSWGNGINGEKRKTAYWEKILDELIATYNLKAYRAQISAKRPALRKRKYLGYPLRKNRVFVVSELLKYVYNQALHEFYDSKHKEAIPLFEVACFIYSDNEEDLDPRYKEELRRLGEETMGTSMDYILKKYH